MLELIDRQSALGVCKEYGWVEDEVFIEGYNTAIKDIRGAIKELPAIEVKSEAKPERHGRWIFVGKETMHDGWTYSKYKCSECNFMTVEAINFCQNCGTKMDLNTPTEVPLDEADNVMMGSDCHD